MVDTSWKLWLDDQAYDPETPERWAPEGYLIATTSQEAVELVKLYGAPIFMDLDHDLGEVNGQTDDACKFLRWLQEHHTNNMPDYQIHSRNVEGQKNILSIMNSWQRFMELP